MIELEGIHFQIRTLFDDAYGYLVVTKENNGWGIWKVIHEDCYFVVYFRDRDSAIIHCFKLHKEQSQS